MIGSRSTVRYGISPRRASVNGRLPGAHRLSQHEQPETPTDEDRQSRDHPSRHTSRAAAWRPGVGGGSLANTFDVLLVRLETEDGVVGWGEAFSRMEDRALKQMIDDRVLPLVLGRDAKEISRDQARPRVQSAQPRSHRTDHVRHFRGRHRVVGSCRQDQRAPFGRPAGRRSHRPCRSLCEPRRAHSEDAAAAAVRRAIGEGYR